MNPYQKLPLEKIEELIKLAEGYFAKDTERPMDKIIEATAKYNQLLEAHQEKLKEKADSGIDRLRYQVELMKKYPPKKAYQMAWGIEEKPLTLVEE